MFSNAPEALNEPFECECGGTYVMYEGDKICDECGGLCGSEDQFHDTNSTVFDDGKVNPWTRWQNERRENDDYSGWHGENRIKMVGGFIGPWNWVEDEYLA